MPYRNQEADFAALMEGQSEKVQEIVTTLRKWMAKHYPMLEEEVKLGWRNITYKKNGVICAIAPYKNHVAFHFYRGVELNDPDTILQGEGTTLRHLKIKKADKIPTDQLTYFLEQALLLDEGKQATPA